MNKTEKVETANRVSHMGDYDEVKIIINFCFVRKLSPLYKTVNISHSWV